MSEKIAMDQWETESMPYELPPAPIPGVYALYQRGVLKYIGESGDCYFRVHRHRTPGPRRWLEGRPGWEAGVPFTARVMEMPGSNKLARTEREKELIRSLQPPCNRRKQ